MIPTPPGLGYPFGWNFIFRAPDTENYRRYASLLCSSFICGLGLGFTGLHVGLFCGLGAAHLDFLGGLAVVLSS